MASVEPLASPSASAAPAHHVNTWFFMCGPLAVNVFVFGLAWNLHVFKKHEFAIDKVLDMRRDEIPTAKGVALFACLLTAIQMTIFGAEAMRRGDSFGVDEVRMELLLLLYCTCGAMLMLCPFDIMHLKCRMFVLRKIGRCLWPFQYFSLQLPAHPTPFIEVFLADGLTSLSKFIQDSAVAMLLLSISFTQETDDLRASYVTKMKQSPLPYFAASAPYIIRATQCLISFQRTSSVNDRFLHLLNTLKYCSSLLVIFVGAYPQIMGQVMPDKSSFFLLCAVFNSMYSFLWDVIMDWGLGQPNLPRRVRFLRHQLLFKPKKLYYVVIVVDFLLRILWVTKWWDWEHYGVDFKLVSQVAEVVRRVVWNNVRVEWQCIKLEILGTKKLSEDSMELEQSLENMPLMADDDDDEDTDSDSRADDKKNSEPDLEGGNDGGARLKKAGSELIAPAAITVATFPGKTPVTVIHDATATTHQRKGVSPNPSFEGEEEAMGLLPSDQV
ncbi:Inositol monophosphatase, partial [Globisporangium splendens]